MAMLMELPTLCLFTHKYITRSLSLSDGNLIYYHRVIHQQPSQRMIYHCLAIYLCPAYAAGLLLGLMGCSSNGFTFLRLFTIGISHFMPANICHLPRLFAQLIKLLRLTAAAVALLIIWTSGFLISNNLNS